MEAPKGVGIKTQLRLIQAETWIRKFPTHHLRIPEFGFGQLQSFCGTLNQPGNSLGSFLNDLKPPEHPDPRFSDSRFWPFRVSHHRNGPGWYIYRGSTLIKSSGSSFMMYVHPQKNFWWSESEWNHLIQSSYGPSKRYIYMNMVILKGSTMSNFDKNSGNFLFRSQITL